MPRLALVTALAVSLPTLAAAFTAENRFSVAPVDGAVFEVVGRPGASAANFWCAAGDYARDALGAPTNARIYVVAGPGNSVSEPGRKAVRFTLDPAAAGITAIAPQLSLSVKVVGDNLSVASAVNYCHNDISKI